MVGWDGELVGVLHQSPSRRTPLPLGRLKCGCGWCQEGVQPVFSIGIKRPVKITTDQCTYAQRALVVLLAVLRRANVHPHQDAQLGLQSEPFSPCFAVHLAQVGHLLGSAIAIFHAVKTVQVGGRFHPLITK